MHSLTWSFDLGLGGYLGNLFDPLLLLTGWLPESWQLASRLPMFAFRVIVAGGFFYGYLRLLRFESRIAVLGALGYAFSSYGMLNAQWDAMHGTEFVQLSAFLFLFEKYLATRSRWAAIMSGFVIGIGHPMGLYMFALFGLIYALARTIAVPASERWNHVRRTFGYAGWNIPGLLIAAPLLFPALYYFLESARVSGDHSQMHFLLSLMFHINERSTISSEFAGLVGKDLLGSDMGYAGVSNYFEGPGFYVGLLPLLCIPQLLGPNATNAERKLCIIGLIGVALYFAFPALRFAVYGFGSPGFRFSTLWISALLLVLGLAGLRRIMESGLWRSGMAAGAGFVLAIPAAAILLLPAQVNVEQVIRIAAFASAYTAILFMTRGTSRRTGLHHVLLPIVACELLMFAMPPAVERDAVRLDGSGSIGNFHDGSDQALAFVRQYNRQLPSDADFYRIDKSYYSSFLNDALVQDYPGTSSYFHQTSSITRFVDRMNLDRITQGPNYISSMSNRRDVMDLLGVRYLLSLDRKPDAERDLTLLATVGNVNIYRNATAHAFGTFYPAIASESEADVLPVPQRDAFLLSHIVVEDPQATRAELASLNTGSAGGHPGQQAHIKESRDDQLSGTVETPSASALLLSMPFDRGWSAVLDDAPLPLFRADYGLTGALIPAGSHRLMLSYTPPGRMLGWWLATGSLGFLLGLHMVRRNAMVARPPRRMLSNSP